MLNIEKVDALIEHLKQIPDKQFDMSDWGYKDRHCGTVACIAGHATAMYQPKLWRRYLNYDLGMSHSEEPSAVARRELGLSRRQANQLFMPGSALWTRYEDKHLDWTDKQIAIQMLTDMRNRAAKRLIKKAMGDPLPVSLLAENNRENEACIHETPSVASR